MSEAWSQWRDIDRLSDGQVDLEYTIPLSAFPRLPEHAAAAGGEVSGVAHFRREGGFAVAQLTVTGSVPLICQRCLAPMQCPIDGEAAIALVASEADAEGVPPQFEPVRAPEGRIRLRDLIEEEVLLALPIVPLHASPEDCAPQAQATRTAQAEPAQTQSTQRPFAGLGELMKR